MAAQLGVVVTEEPTQLGILRDFFEKAQWAKTMVEVNLAAATAAELLAQISSG